MKVVDEPLSVSDPKVHELVRAEERRQAEKIRLIPSENYVSRAVLEASGSVFTNKYSEGYAQKRYYEGSAERRPAGRAGARARLRPVRRRARQRAALLGLAGQPRRLPRLPQARRQGDGPGPADGRAPDPRLERLDHRQVLPVGPVRRAQGHRPHRHGRGPRSRPSRAPALIWAGGTAYSRHWDFAAFAEIAKEVGARFAVDMAHIAGPDRGRRAPDAGSARGRGQHDDPQDPARSARRHDPVQAALRVRPSTRRCSPACRAAPRSQHRGIAVALNEAAQPAFKQYAHNVVANAKVLAAELMARGFHVFRAAPTTTSS
jgi:glycine hydroxymethyltransferase